MGRPPKGVLCTFDPELCDKVKQLRKDNEGWGAQMILVELEEEFSYAREKLPSASTVNRYLKRDGFIKPREPVGKFPSKPCEKPGPSTGCWRWTHRVPPR